MMAVAGVVFTILAGSFVLAYAINTVRLFLAKRKIDKSLKGEKPNDGGTD